MYSNELIMKAEAYIVKFDEKNQNGRTYPSNLRWTIISEHARIAENMHMKGTIGTFPIRKDFAISLVDMTHVVYDIVYDKEKNALKCQFDILDTLDNGNLVRTCLENGVKLYATIVGSGTANKDGVIEDYKFISVDFDNKPNGFGDDFCQVKIINE